MINIPISQSIRFRPINTSPANFDNTYFNEGDGKYVQFVNPYNLKIQLSRLTASPGVAKMFVLECNGTETECTNVFEFAISDRTFTTFDIDFSGWIGKKLRLKTTDNSVLTHISESFTVEEQPTFYKLNWFNKENSFLTDYSNGLVNEMMLEAAEDWNAGGESSVYTNQGEPTILKDITTRIMTLKGEAPDYICEQLRIAMAHDSFFVNEIQQVKVKEPTFTRLGRSSRMYSFTIELQQKTIIGINTHDVG